ncbi:dihydroorotase [Cavenderia fasciculata]|uniref:Dihydroorotase n=1 Tax=Cavenderia fasciculata TaxID=261658 RepID=F4PJS2_CACFS|nr:dihydroorotase [Cavenderia fasciculata]EGG23846.1 dihydroorotase [Cavenderia fasciculata]|eukprot:XP_004361697.1 dihydroorotase [Cavenderia fasciculata]
MDRHLNRKKGYLILEDGVKYEGFVFGATKSVNGECVFTTGMVGYPEAISDPSYTGQILVFSYPLIGNYGVPSFGEVDPNSKLPVNFESDKAHVQAIICSDYTDDYSHWAAESSLSEWLESAGIPGLYGIDTRSLITHIRVKGSLMGKVIVEGCEPEAKIPFEDINLRNLVAEVSTKQIRTFQAAPNVRKNKRVIVLDCGVKYNQLRILLNRGMDLKVVPWDYDVLANEKDEEWDGLFISNGPGDPSLCTTAINNIRKVLNLSKPKPVFGVCMGNQLLGLAAGAKTHKMPFGNRGLNQPCVDQISGRCHITSQNHGFVIDTDSLPKESGWNAYFINANDQSNEGIYHKDKPFSSVQFHPEARAGPTDTEYLFDNFVQNVLGVEWTSPMNKSKIIETPKGITKVLLLGSGGLSIGQAGEFDYSGSQAIKALKEEGIKTVLINPNIATVQTSPGLADKVYFLPVNAASVTKVIINEKPDGILVTFGGQTALNCGIELYKSGILEKYNVKVMGTPIDTIISTEDRGIFAEKLAEINERIAPSEACNTMEESLESAKKIGYPVIVRAAYCLGGLGSGFANNPEELTALVTEALATSTQVLIEKSLKGWKEIEYEVLRDSHDNCITVCNMENFDPLGIHTGESIVVAPSQTLTDREYQMLREVAIKTVRHLGVVGECNIQYALNPDNEEYCIIEVNARLSRSSALASKATGYPLAFISAKVALGYDLATLRNNITKKTTACFEPSLDYLVVKMPRWDLKKFSRVSPKISSSMKSVGEVMSIGRKFEEAIQKAIRMVTDNSVDGFAPGIYPTSDEELEHPTNNRILVLASAFADGYTVERVHQLTKIDRWFLTKLKDIIDLENRMVKMNSGELPRNVMLYAKQQGFSDKQIGRAIGTTELAVREMRKKMDIIPFIKHIDTVAAEFPAQNNYLYMTYNAQDDDIEIKDKAYITLGSGAYRIGSSVEFDWCAVSCIRTLRKLGQKSIMINFNPETVSTDYDECDYLFFEELSLERVMDIYEVGGPDSNNGVILSVGGQIPNNLAIPLSRCNVKVLGTHPDSIDSAENRYKFSRMLDAIGIDQPLWKELTSVDDTKEFCETVGFPCLVRPSYVLSGAAMNVVNSSSELEAFLTEAAAVSRDYPVVISKFIQEAKEIEIDAVADNGQIVLFAISEHVENAGVHSGDATIVCPAQDLDANTIAKIEETARKIAAALAVSGPFNIQFIAKNNEIKVIECNLRCSRSFPFVSKTLNVDFIELATKIIIQADYKIPQLDQPNFVGVKVPQFSFIRLKGADPVLGVEMASTGEVACFGNTREEAYIKGLISTGFRVPEKNVLLSIGSFKEKQEFLSSARKLVDQGYVLFGTKGTADFYTENNVECMQLDWDEEGQGDNITKKMTDNTIHLFINLPSKNKYRRPSSFMSRGYSLRRVAVDFQVPLITNIKCAKLFVESIAFMRGPMALDRVDCRSSSKTITLPGLVDVHVHLRDPGATHKEDWDSGTAAALAGGFTIVGAMPNTSPAIMDHDTFELAKSLASSKARCDYGIFLGATITNTTLLNALAPESMGVKMYLEETFATLPLRDDLNAWKEHVINWNSPFPICVHADGRNLAAILFLGHLYNKHIHVCHVSHKEEVDLIRDAKLRGVHVTCEVSPHHLVLCQKDIERIGSGQSEVRPKLGTEEDRQALWDNLDYIDMIATDHAPHTYEEKISAKPPPGFPGLETSLPLMLTAVHEGRLTLQRLREMMHDNPIRIFNLPEQPNTYIEVDMDEEWVIPKKLGFTRCGWTPFSGLKVRGRVTRVVLRGKLAYLDGKVIAQPGYGQNVRTLVPTTPREVSSSLAVPAVPVESSPKKQPAQSMTSPNVLPLVGTLIKKDNAIQLFHPHDSASLSAMKHIYTVKQFDRKILHNLFGLAHEMRLQVKKSGGSDALKGKVLATLFYEPSTRTQCSFSAAFERLGGSVIAIDSASSSVVKGESLADTVRTLECYADAICIRHPQVGAIDTAIKYAKKPIINAGDGVGEHPTQALLDVFTIREELGTVNGLTITVIGDLKNGRTVHSLVHLLSLYQVKINYVSPASLAMPEKIIKELTEKGIEQHIYTKLTNEVLSNTNVLYVTRVQKERFQDLAEYEAVKDSFIITPHTLTHAMDNMIVMHPLPRVNEISQDVDSDPRAAYFRQMENGIEGREDGDKMDKSVLDIKENDNEIELGAELVLIQPHNIRNAGVSKDCFEASYNRI